MAYAALRNNLASNVNSFLTNNANDIGNNIASDVGNVASNAVNRYVTPGVETYDNVPPTESRGYATPNVSFLHQASPGVGRRWGQQPHSQNYRRDPVVEHKIAKVYGTYKLLNRFFRGFSNVESDHPGLPVFKTLTPRDHLNLVCQLPPYIVPGSESGTCGQSLACQINLTPNKNNLSCWTMHEMRVPTSI